MVVVGASGDLAKKKTYPSLFALFENDLLPSNVTIWGYARSQMTHQDLRQKLRPYLLNNNNNNNNDDKIDEFLSRCYYKNGKSYGDEQAFTELMRHVHENETTTSNVNNNNRLFYLAIPPNVFGETGVAIKRTALLAAEQHDRKGWTRLVIEKPFGRDLDSCNELMRVLSEQFEEHHLYRIDHYLGKEVVQNLIMWRFGNSPFEFMWNRNAIQCVLLTFQEEIGTQGRGGYFDNYGIIRDILQNHLLQVLTLLAMEPPTTTNDDNNDDGHPGDYIRNGKARVLQAMPPVLMSDCLLGQYEGYAANDDSITNKETQTPTYAALRCFVNTPRWEGVPFVMQAGKALNERKCEIRIQFRDPPPTNELLFNNHQRLPKTELVMRIQPNPAIYMVTNMKSPGFSYQPKTVPVGMEYGPLIQHNPRDDNPDAYTRLILDVLRGRQGSFVRNDELRRSWEIFTPLLHEIEQRTTRRSTVEVHPYAPQSHGPAAKNDFLRRMGVHVVDENDSGTTPTQQLQQQQPRHSAL